MRERLLISPPLILGVIGVLWLDQWLAGRGVPAGSAIAVVMGVLIWIGASELAAMCRIRGVEVSDAHLRLCAVAGGAAMYVGALRPVGASTPVVASAAVGVLFLSMVSYARRRSPPGVGAFAGASLLAFAYLGLMFGFAFALLRDRSPWVLLWIVLVAKAADTGAYFTGRAIGRHKLIPWLSPGKTWEGLAGGIVYGAGFAALGAWALERWDGAAPLSVPLSLAFGLVAAVMGQAGDLMASFLKRDAGVKDSGRALPGLGGVLDVVDSVLLMMPVGYWFLRAGA